MDIINFFSDNFWATCATLSSLTVVIAGFLNTKLNTNKVWKQVVAWATSIILTVGGYFVGAVSLDEPVYITIILTGIVVGLSSNGIYDIPQIKELVNKMNKNVTPIK